MRSGEARAAGLRAGRVIPHPGVREDFTAYVGMVVFLASWAMMFASLFFAYGIVRSRAPVWPPLDQPPLPRLLPGVNAGVAALSSLAVVSGLRALRAGRAVAGARALWAATALGAAFLGLQALLWIPLWRGGLRADSGPYASVFWAITGFHAAHVAVGLFALALLGARAGRGAYRPPQVMPVRLWAMYWHFVGIVWLLIYVTLFLF
jgi:cytochrome c oxidase subunit 3